MKHKKGLSDTGRHQNRISGLYALARLGGSLALILSTALSTQAEPLIELAEEARQNAADGSFAEINHVEEILRDMIQIRGLELKRPVQINTLNREQLQKKLVSQIDTEVPPEKIAAEEDFYKSLGMLAPDFDYRQFFIDLYTEQIGGYYDPKTKELRLIQGAAASSLEQKLLIAHELTHALQDQHFSLEQLMDSQGEEDDDDAVLAQMSLIEGDATVAATEYIQLSVQRESQKNPLGSFFNTLGSVWSAVKAQQRFATFRSAPRFIQSSLTFPYEFGARFINHYRSAWEWSQFSQFYTQPPRSTEEILHPALYGSEVAPQAISEARLRFDKTRPVSSNVWGELGYLQYFQHYLDRKQAFEAAEGWNGDRYAVYRLHNRPGPVLAFASHWDSLQDAQEFTQAWKDSWKIRFPDASLRKYEQWECLSASPLSDAKPTPKQFCLRQNNQQILVLEGLPPQQSAQWRQALSKALSQNALKH